MNRIDLVLVLLLVACALRGYWRGFFRECFAVLALVGGLVAASQFTALGEAWLQRYGRLPAVVQTGLSFVVIFSLVHIAVNSLGVFIDRPARGWLMGGFTRLGGALMGTGKGLAVSALVLLFLHLFSVPRLDEQIMSSRIGRPLVSAAGDVIRLSLQSLTPPAAPSQT
jgi:uncharacterized membrane protein required for colicin V production